MGKIIILDENTSNKIAAGEVVERPASVVKELVENSIDAGAGAITIELSNGGIRFIKVLDNGSGIHEDDIEIAFERHATSKIRNSKNLEAISTLGFRGEALASIASVSRVELCTKTRNAENGNCLHIQGGIPESIEKMGCPEGTSIIIKDLFYNTPARYKFLKKDSTEARYITDIISRVALGNPHISFRLMNNGNTVLHTPGNNDLLSTIFSIYGKDTAKNVRKVTYDDNVIKIFGYIGRSDAARSNRTHQSFFVNGRYIKSTLISAALDRAFNNFIVKGRYPFAVLNIEVNPEIVDVNVHPTKLEIRFSDEQQMFRAIYSCIRSTLENNDAVSQPLPGISEKMPININKGPSRLNGLDNNKNSRNFIQSSIEDYSVTAANDNTGDEVLEYRKPSLFDDWHFVGQVFSTYLIFEKEDAIYIVDQHAAHERIKYEETLEAFSSGEKLSQQLAGPIIVELTAEEIDYVAENRDFVTKLGFEFESFGNNSIMLRAVPYHNREVNFKDEFCKLLDYLMTTNVKNNHDYMKEVIYKIACSNAIKAHKKLDAVEVSALLEQLEKAKNPMTCPHGRPTIINISKNEFERKFKRKL